MDLGGGAASRRRHGQSIRSCLAEQRMRESGGLRGSGLAGVTNERDLLLWGELQAGHGGRDLPLWGGAAG